MKKLIVRAKAGAPANLSKTFLLTLNLISNEPTSLEKLAKKRKKCFTTIASQVKMLESMGYVRRFER